jgi:V8-like Glu-specific endopeptidase
MGRLWLSSTDLFGTKTIVGFCSGTVVGTNIVLTAGHCAYNAESGRWFQDVGTVFFDPNNQFAANGGATEVENASAPYGSWDVQRSYVPQCYVDTASLACDVGLLVMSPNARGDIGTVVGSYPVVGNVTGVGVGTQVNSAGYPAGGGFASYENGMGNAPYFCQNALTAGSGLPGGFDGTDTGSFLQTFECPMTGGASGGPVFIKLADGQWYIWGVNNHADYRRLNTPFSKLTGTQPFGDTFLTLWRQVTGQG